jgi:transporter family-2 protein
MSTSAYVVGIVTIGGLAAVIQAHFIGIMETRMGIFEAVFITYASGGLAIAVAIAVTGGGQLSAWRTVPWWAFTAGLIGLLIVGSIGFATPRIGLVALFTVLVASQFVFAALFDHFGWLGTVVRQMDLSRATGIVVLLVGVWLILR